MKIDLRRLLLVLASAALSHHLAAQGDIKIPLGGNVFFEKNGTAKTKLSAEGIVNWQDAAITPVIYVRPGQTGRFEMALIARNTGGKSQLAVQAKGSKKTTITINSSDWATYAAGSLTVTDTGYTPIRLQGLSKSNNGFADISYLVIKNLPDTTKARYVKDEFYWGRRGPSVHLNYPLPKDIDFEYFYNELTIPEGSDPQGSYFMSNGFGEGYCGIQVNGPDERRVLFSVWAPFTTDDPTSIPDSLRIKLLQKGEGVHIGEFGNEGSGGQSYLKYSWKAGNTYRFLTRIHPDGKGNTAYTSWFYAPEKGSWMLIASFLRPKTNTWYKRPHSFLENFNPEMGAANRLVYTSNQWACDKNGQWHELTQAGFTADATARKQARMDYAGGEKEGRFYMTNCGFFKNYTPIGSQFTRAATGQAPVVPFEDLKIRD